MKKFSKNSIAIVTVLAASFVFGFIGPSAAHAATTPSLGDAATYGILSDTYTNTNVPLPTTINGDVGFTTGPAVAPLGVHPNYGSGTPYATAGTAQAAALVNLNGQGCDFTFVAPAVVLDTTLEHSPTYGPGVYCSTGAMSIGTAGGITLSGSGTYIFRSGGALNAVTGSTVNLGSGASACDVFWTPNGGTTLNANSAFVGTVIPNVAWDITVLDATSWIGRALAFGQTVTTPDANVVITVPTCSVPATLHVVKQVVNTSGGTAIPSNFTLHVKIAGVDVSGSPAAGLGGLGTPYSLSAGAYVVSEDVNTSYVQSFGGACDSSGNVTLLSGDDKTCTIVNTDIPSPIVVSGGGGGVIIPLIGILKVPTPLALPTGPGSVTYNYTVWNVGGRQAMTRVTVVDDKCGPVIFLSGDLNGNSNLDPGEYWKYSCTTTLQVTTTNTAIATGHTGDQTAIATAVATVIVYAPIRVLGIATTTPSFPNTGLPPEGESAPLDIVIISGILMVILTSLVVVLKKAHYLT